MTGLGDFRSDGEAKRGVVVWTASEEVSVLGFVESGSCAITVFGLPWESSPYDSACSEVEALLQAWEQAADSPWWGPVFDTVKDALVAKLAELAEADQ